MAKDEKVYLPRMTVRNGQRHSYQGKNVVIVEPGQRDVTADEDAKAARKIVA